MTTQSQRPSEVRARILEEHTQLRRVFLHVVERARATEPDRAAELIGLADALYLRLVQHLALEERILVPILREVDSWGPIRVHALLEDHARQRTRLRELTRLAHGACDPAELSCALETLARDLEVDMKDEEQGLLGADLLSDSLVVSNQDSG